jgi:endonuclease V-like protein UPF0215 family
MVLLAIDDCGFTPNFKFLKEKPYVPLIALYFKNNNIIDIKVKKIKIDGLDATEKLIEILNERKAELILSEGITFGGFNIIDFVEIYEKLKIPSLIILEKLPNMQKVFDALIKHFPDYKIRIGIINKLPPIKSYKDIFFEAIGISEEEAIKIINKTRIFSKLPEPLRIAHILGYAIYKLKTSEFSF